jgi:hypothetical protein
VSSVGVVFTVTRTRGVQFDLIIAIRKDHIPVPKCFILLTSKSVPPAAALTFGTQMVRQFAYFKISHIP